MERSELSQKPELIAAIVCVLPDRGRLERGESAHLFALLGRLGAAAGAVILVGGESSELSAEWLGAARLTRGADPLTSALARGAEAALAREAADVVVLVTPELASWRAEESALADPPALAIVARLGGAAGWRAHLDDDAPLREGLLVVAADLWRRRARNFAAAESWGDLEARIRSAGAAIFDLRALRRLGELGLTAPAVTRGLASGLTRSLAKLAGLGQEIGPRFTLDQQRLPWIVRHGEPVPVELSGWVALLPQASELELRIAGRRYPIPVELSRPDVLVRFPDLADDRCGFRFAEELAPFPPGIHRATLVVLPARAERELGAVRVIARLDVVCDRLLAPPVYPTREGLPLRVDGRVIASHPPIRIEAWIDGRQLELEPAEDPVHSVTKSVAHGAVPGDGARPVEIGFRLSERVVGLREAQRHRLELRAFDSRGRSARIERTVETCAGEKVGAAIEVELVPRDPRSGRCGLVVRGALFSPAIDSFAVLEIEGVEVGRAALNFVVGARLRLGTFDLRVDPRLEPGAHELSIALEGPSAREVIERKKIVVTSATPKLAVGRVELESRGDTGNATLRIEGEIAGASLIDAVRVTFDGRPLVDVDPRSFFESTGAMEEERRQFRLAQPVHCEPGRHRLLLELRHARETLAAWEGELQSQRQSRDSLEVVSADLDRLRRVSPAPVWSALAFDGELRSAPEGTELALLVDGVELERVAPRSDGRFGILRRLEPGLHSARLEVAVGVETVARLPTFEVMVRPLEIPDAWASDLDDVRAALGPAASRLDGLASSELLRCHVEQHPGEMADLSTALAALARQARAAIARPGRIVGELPRRSTRRLRTLFFSWEIPWSGHGGGAAIVNLLRALGERHEIVLLHPVHAGGEGLSEEIRSAVAGIITIPRAWSRPSRPAPLGIPEALLPTYTEELVGAVSGELASGKYDLANFEYAGSYFYAQRSPVPSLLVDLDVSSFALTSGVAAAPATERAAAGWTRELLGALVFDVLRLPERVDRVATLTEPEARFLLSFLPGQELFVSPLAFDVDPRPIGGSAVERRARALFVLVGNYRHPPNRDAARRLIERIAPRLRAALPGAGIVLAGAELPAELYESARAAGIDCPGFVPDLARLYAGATATLAPIDSGGGMRVKLLAAMACGCPVVTTALGMNGISASAGEEFLLARTDDEFVDAALRLSKDESLGEALAARARALLEREQSSAVQAERRERIWVETIAAKGPTRR